MHIRTVRWFSFAVLSLALGLIFFACSSAPTEEINATRTSVTAAQTPDVTAYAPESLREAEDALNKAMAEVQVQDNKFALSRDYAAATAMLKEAKDKAARAEADAETKKAQTKAAHQGGVQGLIVF